jgi:hypothetical protein
VLNCHLLSAERCRLNEVLDNDMKDTVKLLDVVALTVDLPAHGDAFEVEFSDSDGRTYASLGLRPDQIMVLRYEPLPARDLVPA